MHLDFGGGRVAEYTQKIKTPRYSKTDENFWYPRIVAKVRPKKELSFSYFLFESGQNHRHVVADIDGELRWALPLPEVKAARRPLYRPNASHEFGSVWLDRTNVPTFVVHRDGKLIFSPLTSANSSNTKILPIDASRFGISNIITHHEIAPGKTGYLVNITADKGGKRRIESIVLEVDRRGTVLEEWDFGEIVAQYMRDKGDANISRLVRPGVDWLHINSAIYSDDSIIISGRENFVMKVGYRDKKIKWLFGDKAKHWNASYPSSLAQLALTVNGKPPIGQHALSLITFNGQKALLLQRQSIGQLPGVSQGKTLSSSLAQAWKIDEASKTADLLWEYDAGISSLFCSSVYQAGTQYLVTYSLAPNNKVVTRGIDQNKNILFESEGRCAPWNNKIIRLDDLRF